MLPRLLGSISLRSLAPPWIDRSHPKETMAPSATRPAPSSALFAASAVTSSSAAMRNLAFGWAATTLPTSVARSEEHTSELQSRLHLVCRLLLEKKKKTRYTAPPAKRHTT